MANAACLGPPCSPAAKSAATDAPGLSAATSSTGGAVSSSRSRSAQGHRGDDAALQHAWTVLGLPERYDPPDEQEIKDLADRRHQKRGERKRKRRLEANWKLYEREAQHAEAAQPEVAAGPALPAYLLERGEAIRPAAANAPTYIDVAALRARLQPSTAAQQDGDVGESAIVCAFSPTELMYHLYEMPAELANLTLPVVHTADEYSAAEFKEMDAVSERHDLLFLHDGSEL